MNYNIIGISINRRCTAKCKVCCVSAGMYESEGLSVKQIEQYLKGLKHADPVRMVCFSGGEPFLEYEKLLHLVEYVHKCGKKAAVVSNCFWADAYESAYKKLKRLVDSGLSELTISYDSFHEEYIDTEYISNAIKACRNLQIPAAIQTVIMRNSKNAGWINQLGGQLNGIKINYVPAYPVGYAEKNFAYESYIRNTGKMGLLCRKNGAFSVESDGTIYPCCSPYIVETALAIGNVYDQVGLTETFERLEKHLILHALRNYGFDLFIKLADELEIKVPDRLIASCELCAILFNKDNIKKFIPYIKHILLNQ